MASVVGIDVDLLKSEIKKTYARSYFGSLEVIGPRSELPVHDEPVGISNVTAEVLRSRDMSPLIASGGR